MFKEKKSIYILLPINIFIWGYMGYKIYLAFNENDESGGTETIILQTKLRNDDSVNYILAFNYKDPFLKEESKVRSYAPVSVNPVSRTQSPSKPLAHEKEQEIIYLGLIENKTSGATTGMVSVNGNSHIIRPGQVLGGMQFQNITHDFIVVKKGKEKLIIRK